MLMQRDSQWAAAPASAHASTERTRPLNPWAALRDWSADPAAVRVAGECLYRGYTEAVALVGDTAFVLDATPAEARARQDEEWIAKLFHGDHPVVVVVTDLAWPHIAGVRYWVARGATIVSHRASEDSLRRVVERRWTREPDLLERVGGAAPPAHPWSDVRRLAGVS